MEIYLPTLEEKIVTLVGAFRFIVFAIMVAGLMVHAARQSSQGAQLFTAIAKELVVVAAIGFMNVWFPKVEQVFLNVAEFIDPGYNADPTSASQAIPTRRSVAASSGWHVGAAAPADHGGAAQIHDDLVTPRSAAGLLLMGAARFASHHAET